MKRFLAFAMVLGMLVVGALWSSQWTRAEAGGEVEASAEETVEEVVDAVTLESLAEIVPDLSVSVTRYDGEQFVPFEADAEGVYHLTSETEYAFWTDYNPLVASKDDAFSGELLVLFDGVVDFGQEGRVEIYLHNRKTDVWHKAAVRVKAEDRLLCLEALANKSRYAYANSVDWMRVGSYCYDHQVGFTIYTSGEAKQPITGGASSCNFCGTYWLGRFADYE